ncbi:MAG: CDP-diacylglycerol O-phosphatidyltransferase [Nocardioides sp.]
MTETGDPSLTAPAAGERPPAWAAWLVHGYTASGVLLAFWMVLWSFEGRTEGVLWLFLISMFIDGTDGLLARKVRVKEATPWFDGGLLDNIVDYITYAFAPMIFLWVGGYLPGGTLGAVAVSLPLLASCYQFCRTDAKTEDHCFLGFPDYWNVLAFYVVVLGVGETGTVWLLLIFSVLVFVPIRYVYPSRTELLWYTNMSLTGLWLIIYALIVGDLADPHPVLVALSLAYVAFYVAESLVLTFRHRRRLAGLAG